MTHVHQNLHNSQMVLGQLHFFFFPDEELGSREFQGLDRDSVADR